MPPQTSKDQEEAHDGTGRMSFPGFARRAGVVLRGDFDCDRIVIGAVPLDVIRPRRSK